jgi:hypothetical protein
MERVLLVGVRPFVVVWGKFLPILKRLYEKSGSMLLLVRNELLCVSLGQACEHQTQHGQIDHGLTTAGLVLIVLAHAPIAADPGQRALHDLAARQMTKAAWALEGS